MGHRFADPQQCAYWHLPELVQVPMKEGFRAAGAEQAMTIVQFDKMAQDDRAEYVSELVSGAEKVLTDEGKRIRPQKLKAFSRPMRLMAILQYEQDPNARRL